MRRGDIRHVTKNRSVKIGVIKTSKKITVFKTWEKKDFLKTFLRKLDNTFGPMGSGGYKITERLDDTFIFTELDRAPAHSYIVKVRGKEIYAGEIADFISGVLIKSEIPFETLYLDRPPEVNIFEVLKG